MTRYLFIFFSIVLTTGLPQRCSATILVWLPRPNDANPVVRIGAEFEKYGGAKAMPLPKAVPQPEDDFREQMMREREREQLAQREQREQREQIDRDWYRSKADVGSGVKTPPKLGAY